jgi:hypothetical protein
MRDGILFTKLLVLKKTEITRLQDSRCLLSLYAYIQMVYLFVKEKIPILSDFTRSSAKS